MLKLSTFAVLSRTGDVPDWYCEQYEGVNASLPHNETTAKSCSDPSGHKCVKFAFVDSFTSIVSKVSCEEW